MIFLDTGAFLARYIRQDQFHQQAEAHWKRLRWDRETCCTSNHVLDELFTLLARKTDYEFAAERAQHLMRSTSLVIWRSTEDDEHSAVDLFQKFSDQKVSFTDCISFALMRKHNIRRVFTFDEHFEYAGFTMEPLRTQTRL